MRRGAICHAPPGGTGEDLGGAAGGGTRVARAWFIVALVGLLFGSPGQAREAPEGRFFDSDGVRIHYVDEGSGEPVLLIHGFTADLRVNWVEPKIFGGLRDAGFRVVAYDTRGHGKSDKPHDPEKYGPVEIEDAIRLLDHLGLRRVHVVGYSRGGRIAGRLRARHPDRVRALTLGAWADPGDGKGWRDRAPAGEIADALAEGNVAPLVRWVDPGASAELIEAVRSGVGERNDMAALAAAFRAGDSFPDLSKRDLASNEVPTLALVGSEDPFREDAQRMAEVMSELEVLVIPGATHSSTGRRPEFLTGLLGFLTKHQGGQGPDGH